MSVSVHSSHDPMASRLAQYSRQSDIAGSQRFVAIADRREVNDDGCYTRDMVLKKGSVKKRRKRTNIWDNVRLVLRPHVLSIYKDEDETQLRHMIDLSDITAVATRKDRKRKGEHQGVFGVFSPSRNFHLEAPTAGEAQAWVNLIRAEANAIDTQADVSLEKASPSPSTGRPLGGSAPRSPTIAPRLSATPEEPSSLQGSDILPPPRIRQSYETSDFGSYSGSEAAFGSPIDASNMLRALDSAMTSREPQRPQFGSRPASRTAQREQFYLVDAGNDEERVLWQGHLHCLKATQGIRQWKSYWVVLRAKHLALYKTEEEYAALLIIPITSILDAVETDPVRGKDWCMQVITEDRSYRLCCASEEDLIKWLGALKSLLSKRHDGERKGHV